MKLILNEKVLLNKSLNEGYINDKPSITIRLLAKHFFKIGQDKIQVIDSINNFLEKNLKKYNITKWKDIIRRIVKQVIDSEDFITINIDRVLIYKEELEIIKNINNLKLEKLAFVLLVYSKIYNQINKNKSNWVNSNLKDIFSDTKMVISRKEKSLMINKLKLIGLIDTSIIVNCTNIKILFAKDKGNIAIELINFNDFIYEYLDYKGYKIDICEGKDCCRLFVVKNNHHKFCRDCWKEKQKEWQRESMKKLRNKNM